MSINLSEWMLKIRDDKSLSELSIPGTHDSCARYGGSIYECQTWDLQTQLSNGIRFFDIRCRHYQDKFTIHHEPAYQNLDFPDVRDVCIAFLQQHPSETIIMSIKKEHDDEQNQLTFQGVFNNYLIGFEDFWSLGNVIPKLGDVRGKIVLFRRFELDLDASVTLGIDVNPLFWTEDQTFSIPNSGIPIIRVQDGYKALLYSDAKWERIKRLLDEAETGPPNVLFVNFTSASGGGFPLTFATGLSSPGNIVGGVNPINLYLKKYLVTKTKKRFGIIVMDFPEFPYNLLCGLIVNMNLFQKISFLAAIVSALRNFVRFIINLFR
jgi:1-phosphatidylinositol phosphodiesterase